MGASKDEDENATKGDLWKIFIIANLSVYTDLKEKKNNIKYTRIS